MAGISKSLTNDAQLISISRASVADPIVELERHSCVPWQRVVQCFRRQTSHVLAGGSDASEKIDDHASFRR